MADETVTQSLSVYRPDDETGAETVIGKVDLAADGRLTLRAAAPDQKKFLAAVVQNLNGKDVLHLEIPPDPGDPPFVVKTRPVARGDADFLTALNEYLGKYYKLSLG
jgi:hypothetical protein